MAYIGITENRMRHMLGVARKCYSIAKSKGYTEEFCREMFLIGYLHDIGYEFSEKPSEHSDIGAEIIEKIDEDEIWYAIKNHGKYVEEETIQWKILNMADMQVDSDGTEVDVLTRLKGIKSRYGENSNQYLTACDICYRVGLTPTNIEKNF